MFMSRQILKLGRWLVAGFLSVRRRIDVLEMATSPSIELGIA